MTQTLLLGDCREQMRTLADNSIDAIVTDPPYALVGSSGSGGFMGAKWDSELPTVEMWKEALRVAKPGAHLLAFGGTRTYHRLACAIEDAGWEIRDCCMWVHSQGFPKGQNVSKQVEALLKAGNANETESANAWDGWNTQLKPAVEPIVVARKPLEGTVAANVLKYGTGAINIDACRVPTENESVSNHSRSAEAAVSKGKYGDSTAQETHQTAGQQLGRFPANLIHDGSPEVLALFPDSKGQCGAVKGTEPSELTRGIYGKFSGDRPPCSPRNDSGSAARFFKCCRDGEPSADRRYTAEGSTNFAMKPGMRRPPEDTPARFFYCAKASRSERGSFNDHVTVKPLALMRYLVRLVTRKGGLVLDPFMGSGTTGVAALQEGMNFVGIERDPHYYEIAQRRVSEANTQPQKITQLELPL